MTRLSKGDSAPASDHAIPVVLGLMAARETGKVVILIKKKSKGELFLRHGCIVHAQVGRTEGEPAFEQFLRATEYLLSVESGAKPVKETIQSSWKDQFEKVTSKFKDTLDTAVLEFLSCALKADKADSFEERVGKLVAIELKNLRKSYESAGRALNEIGSERDLAAEMVLRVPSPSVWNDSLGPFYTTSSVRNLLGGISRQAVSDRVRRKTLLAMKTADGVLVYPSFQFSLDAREVIDGLSSVLQCFDPDHVDGWTLATWLVTLQVSLGKKSVVQWLKAGKDTDNAVLVARDAARRFAQ